MGSLHVLSLRGKGTARQLGQLCVAWSGLAGLSAAARTRPKGELTQWLQPSAAFSVPVLGRTTLGRQFPKGPWEEECPLGIPAPGELLALHSFGSFSATDVARSRQHVPNRTVSSTVPPRYGEHTHEDTFYVLAAVF